MQKNTPMRYLKGRVRVGVGVGGRCRKDRKVKDKEKSSEVRGKNEEGV